MIDRDQVLHVARLARLRVTEDDLERMPAELSKILEHVEKMDELDLDGVEPTSHVVDLTNVLRDDEPRPCLPRDKALAGAPDVADGGFRVPSSAGSRILEGYLPVYTATSARKLQEAGAAGGASATHRYAFSSSPAAAAR